MLCQMLCRTFIFGASVASFSSICFAVIDFFSNFAADLLAHDGWTGQSLPVRLSFRGGISAQALIENLSTAYA